VKDIFSNMEDFNHELESFIKYVDSTWIGERNSRTQQRKKPSSSYPHEQWNKFKEVVTGEAKACQSHKLDHHRPFQDGGIFGKDHSSSGGHS
jgi:hypothetical protein